MIPLTCPVQIFNYISKVLTKQDEKRLRRLKQRLYTLLKFGLDTEDATDKTRSQRKENNNRFDLIYDNLPKQKDPTRPWTTFQFEPLKTCNLTFTTVQYKFGTTDQNRTLRACQHSQLTFVHEYTCSLSYVLIPAIKIQTARMQIRNFQTIRCM